MVLRDTSIVGFGAGEEKSPDLSCSGNENGTGINSAEVF